MKREIRVLGIDDGPFTRKDSSVLIVGTVFRGGDWLDGVLSTSVQRDGRDATEKIIGMINRSKFRSQLKAVFLKGIAVGGFNVIDVEELCKQTGKPVIMVVRRFPDYDKMFRALEKIGHAEKIGLIAKVAQPIKIGQVFVQFVGCSREEAERLVKLTTTRSFVPEPLRSAHIIAAGVVKGESRGRA